jgi:hypothetical protein
MDPGYERIIRLGGNWLFWIALSLAIYAIARKYDVAWSALIFSLLLSYLISWLVRRAGGPGKR